MPTYENRTASRHFYVARYYYRGRPELGSFYIGDRSHMMDKRRAFCDTTDLDQAAPFETVSRAKAASRSSQLRPNRPYTHFGSGAVLPPVPVVWEFIRITETTNTTYNLEIVKSTASPLEQLAQAAGEINL